MTGVPASLTGGAPTVAVGAGVATLCVLVAVTALRDTVAVRFYRHRVVTETRAGPFGDAAAAVPYDDVDLVVRDDGGGM